MDTRPTFENWMRTVDRIIDERTGLSVYDLPDCPFRDWYDDGELARTAARKAMRNAQE